jgi:hypothetical protein
VTAPVLPTGQVTWRIYAPDAAEVRVTFVPSAPILHATGLPDPTTVVLAHGTLTAPDGTPLELPATDGDPGGWTWTAHLRIDGALMLSVPFELPTGAVVDLATVVPISESAGVRVLQGPPGPPGTGAAAAVAKVAVWADSMAESQPGDSLSVWSGLATVLGVETHDGANSGWTSTEVAVAQGGLDLFITLAADQIPAGTTPVAATVLPASSFGAAMWLSYPGTLAGVPGTLVKTGDTNAWRFTRTTPGAATAVPPETPFVSTPGVAVRPWVQLFHVGVNNDGSLPDKLRDLKAMAASLGHGRFLVLSQLTGDHANTNAALSDAFGRNFYDLRGWLIRHGLAAAGLSPTAADTTASAAGNIPPSLSADGTHLNAAGRTVEVNRLAALMVARGWFDTFTPLPSPGPGTTPTPALTSTAAPVITGTPTVGSTLSVSAGSWSATPDTVTYQWTRGGTAIAGATAATYLLVSADTGQTIAATVTAAKTGHLPATATATGVAVTAAPAGVTVYTQNFAVAGTHNWQAQAGSSASAVAHDTTRHASGALRWTAASGAGATVENMQGIAILPGQELTFTAKVSHNGAAARQMYVGGIAFAGDFSAQTNIASALVSVPPGAAGTTLTHTVTVPANRALLGLVVSILAPAAGEQAWLDEFTLTRPA